MKEAYSFEVIGFVKQDRSGRVRWLLEELGLPYTSRFLDWKVNENESPEYLALNPTGVVPTLRENGRAIFESGAICMYLAESYGQAVTLAPDLLHPNRGEYLQWVFFVTSTLDAKSDEIGLAENSPEGDPRRSRLPELLNELREICQVLEARLGTQDYLFGNEFSVADILAGNCLAWHLSEELPISSFPRIHAYVERLKARPAVKASGAIKDASIP